MNNKKSLLVSIGLGLAILSFGQTTLAQSDEPSGGLNSDFGEAIPLGQQVSVPITASPSSTTGGNTSDITAFTSESIGGLSIPQDIVTNITGSNSNTIGLEPSSGNFDNNGVAGTSTEIAIVESSSPGNNSDSTITRRATAPGTDSLEGTNINESSGSEISPNKIVICLTDPCVSSDGGENTITVNELAKLIEEDLSQSLNDLAAAERGELNLDENTASQDLTDNPRRIARGQSSNNRDSVTRRDSLMNENCDCVPGERKIVREPANSDNPTISQNFKTVAEARQIVETKLEQSRKFVEQMNQLKPENSIW